MVNDTVGKSVGAIFQRHRSMISYLTNGVS